MRVAVVLALGLLALGNRCPASEGPPPSDRARPHLPAGYALLAGETEPIRWLAGGPPCGAPACGNGQRDSCSVAMNDFDAEVYEAESCDGVDIGGASCELLGYAGGSLACSDRCEWDLSGCEVCVDGRCSSRPVAEGESQLHGFAIAGRDQRTLLVWGTREPGEGRSEYCFYTAFEDETAVPQPQSCALTTWPMLALRVEVDDGSSGYDVEAYWAGRRWTGALNQDGQLVGPGTEDDAPFPQKDCAVVDVGSMQLRVERPAAALDRVRVPPLTARWFSQGHPHGEPIRIASDPRASGCVEGAVVGNNLVLAWESPGRGLTVGRLAVPRLETTGNR